MSVPSRTQPFGGLPSSPVSLEGPRLRSEANILPRERTTCLMAPAPCHQLLFTAMMQSLPVSFFVDGLSDEVSGMRERLHIPNGQENGASITNRPLLYKSCVLLTVRDVANIFCKPRNSPAEMNGLLKKR